MNKLLKKYFSGSYLTFSKKWDTILTISFCRLQLQLLRLSWYFCLHFIKTLWNIQVGISSLRKSFIFAWEKELKVLKLTLLLLCIEEKVGGILLVLIDWILWEKKTWEKISHNKAVMKLNVTFLVIWCCYCVV